MWPKNCSHFEEPKISFRIHNSPPLDPILSHVNPVHAHRNYLFTIHLNIILSSTLWSSNSSLPLSVPPDFYATFPFRRADATVSDRPTKSALVTLRSANHEPYNSADHTNRLLAPSYIQIFPPAPSSQMPSMYNSGEKSRYKHKQNTNFRLCNKYVS